MNTRFSGRESRIRASPDSSLSQALKIGALLNHARSVMQDSAFLSGARKIKRVLLGDQLYEAIKERILDQVYPPGEKLNVDRPARELQVSSTPIREALTRLVAEGPVKAEPFIGFATAPLPDRRYDMRRRGRCSGRRSASL